MDIVRLDPTHALWSDYVQHLRRTNQARWVVDDDGQPTGAFRFLAAVVDGEIVGDLGLRIQPIVVPETEWSGGREHALQTPDGAPLTEAYVQTFHVEEAHRRRGIGSALQEAALAWAGELGCLQMRSWSSLDRPENYAMKLALGFAMDPAVHRSAGGFDVSGVYFVRRVDS